MRDFQLKPVANNTGFKQMTKRKHIEMILNALEMKFRINRHLAAAIIYDDYSVLNDEDEQDINEWAEVYNIDYTTVAYSYDHEFLDDEEPYRFAKCDITGLYGDCIDVIAYKQGAKQ